MPWRAVCLENALVPPQITLKAFFSLEYKSGHHVRATVNTSWQMTQSYQAIASHSGVPCLRKWYKEVIDSFVWKYINKIKGQCFFFFFKVSFQIRSHMAMTGRQMFCREPWRRARCPPGPLMPLEREGPGKGRVCGHVSAAPIQSFGLLLSQEIGNYNWTSPGPVPKPVRARQRDTELTYPGVPIFWLTGVKRCSSFAKLFLKVEFIVHLRCTDASSCHIRAACWPSAGPRSVIWAHSCSQSCVGSL